MPRSNQKMCAGLCVKRVFLCVCKVNGSIKVYVVTPSPHVPAVRFSQHCQWGFKSSYFVAPCPSNTASSG
jgi:hypothetical protein